VCQSNIGFLINNAKDYATMRKFGFSQAPIYASGGIYSSIMFDHLICQSFYNSTIINLLTHLIMGSPKGNTHHSKHKPTDAGAKIKGSSLFHFDIPRSFIGETFEKLFEYLTKYRNILPIGLYRRVGATSDNMTPYVYTNPDPETKLSKYDAVFILSEKIPPSHSIDWGAPFELEEPQKKNDENEEDADNANLIVHEETEKESLRAKLGQKESEMLVNKIQSLMDDLKTLKKDIDFLKKVVNDRQNGILSKIRLSMDQAIDDIFSKMDQKNIQDDQYSENDSSSDSTPRGS
jgi:hypothetical protein